MHMPFDADHIGRLRAAVPTRYQPAPEAAGQLTGDFANVDSRSESTALQGGKLDRHNISVGAALDPDARPSFMLNGAQAQAQVARREELDKRKRDQDRTFEQASAALRARLEQLDAELRAVNQRIGEIERERSAIGQKLDALDDLSALQKRGGKIDPRDPATARLLKRAGIDPAELNGEDLASVVARHRRELAERDGALETEWNDKMKRRDDIERERRPVADALNDIERADSEEARLLAERRALTVLGAQQVGEAAFISNDLAAKRIAADAVASTENAVVREQSGRKAQAAATDTVAFFSKSDDSGWDDPPASTPLPPAAPR